MNTERLSVHELRARYGEAKRTRKRSINLSSDVQWGLGAKVPKPSKYGNKRVRVDGYDFDSKAEAKRYAELRLLQRAGNIKTLSVHPRFPLEVNGVVVTVYEGDFQYWLDGTHSVVEDVKGSPTRLFKLKEKMMKAAYPSIELRIIPVK